VSIPSHFFDTSGNRYAAEGPAWRAEDGTPFAIGPTIEALSEIDFPLVSIGESFTPLVPITLVGREYDCKLEFRQPSGSFKDRGAQTMVSVLKQLGVSSVVEDSSGNAGAALATYAAAAGMKCTIVIPKSARGPVVTQIGVTGARLLRVPGPRHLATERAQQMAREFCYASHIYNPFFYAGTARLADELISQGIPDTIILPVGNGSLLLGLYHGFKRRGPVPRLIAGQFAGMDPIAREFRRRTGDTRPAHGPLHGAAHAGTGLRPPGGTAGRPGRANRPARGLAARVAPGIATAHPARLHEIVSAIQESGGEAASVEAAAVLSAQRSLAERGIYVESTSGVAVAAAEALDAAGQFGVNERVVIILTGSGLKR